MVRHPARLLPLGTLVLLLATSCSAPSETPADGGGDGATSADTPPPDSPALADTRDGDAAPGDAAPGDAAPADGPPTDEPPIARPRFSVSGGFLRDADGRALLLRGANVSDEHKRPPYFDFHQPEDYLRLRQQWGMNAVRFLVSWAAIEPEEDVFDDAYLDAVAERMRWAEEAGLLVVLDMHQDLYGEGFGAVGGNGAPRWTCAESNYQSFQATEPWFANYLSAEVTACFDGFWQSESLQDHFVRAWRRLAERVADSTAIVGFDPLNEPFWGSYPLSDADTFELEKLEPLYERVTEAVREVAPTWIAFLEPAASSNLGLTTGLVRFGPGDAVYSPHSYDPDAESGGGFDEARRQARLARATTVAAEATRLEMGLWIGEYGGIADDPGIAEYMDAQYDAAGQVATGTMYWHYGRDNGYGLLRPDGSEKEALLGVLVRPWPERVAGDPVSYAFDEATSTFTLVYRPDRTLTAPTLVVLPGRSYPGGVTVDCRGCEQRVEDDRLIISRPAEGDELTVTVTPL